MLVLSQPPRTVAESDPYSGSRGMYPTTVVEIAKLPVLAP